MSELSLHDALYTTRAMRRLKPDPVSDDDLAYLIDAATQAPSAENTQSWAFVVITDADMRRKLGDIYRELGQRFIRDAGLASGELPPEQQRIYRSALHLAEHLGEAPALILACLQGEPPSDPLAASTYWGSIYPALQNLMLAARARGLGTTLTTLHKAADHKVKTLLGIPHGVETIALIPVGYPEGSFQRPRRRPSVEVTHRDRWGA